MYLENPKKERKLSVKSDVNFQSFYVFLAIALILQTPSNVFAEDEDATVNPDFGQVEADPATLNLSAYEEYFSERRPFFVKDSTAFDHADYAFFYSRRIGRRPGIFRSLTMLLN